MAVHFTYNTFARERTKLFGFCECYSPFLGACDDSSGQRVFTATLQARREIHAAVAATLERLFPEHSAELAGKLARHYREAGETLRAVEQLSIQADRLERDGALDGALDALEEAIVLYRAMDMTFWMPQTAAALAQVE